MNWSLDEIDQEIEGTPFTWRQALAQGNTGVIAIPTEQQLENIVRQSHALLSVFHLLGGFTVTSWLRTPDHNKSIGGAPKSAHLLGLATDFVPTHMTPDEARKKVKQAGIYPGAGEEGTPTWVHLDLFHTHWFKP